MQDRTGLTVFLVRVVFVLFETRRFCKVARFVFPDLICKNYQDIGSLIGLFSFGLCCRMSCNHQGGW